MIVLTIIADKPKITTGPIAKLLKVDRITIYSICSELDKKGYISRSYNKTENGSLKDLTLELTQEGLKAFNFQ